MLIRGNRRAQILLASGLAVIAIVTIRAVVSGDEEQHAYDRPVSSSTVDDFPTRGQLADDTDVVETAADVA